MSKLATPVGHEQGNNALDLSRLLVLRVPANDMLERLWRGDTEAVPAAVALLDQEDAFLRTASARLAQIGVDDQRTLDALSHLVSELGTGDLGYAVDVACGRVEATR